jgi:hypothetical protein
MIVQLTAAEDIVSGKRYQQRVLDIVVERVAIANAFEREASGRRHLLHELCLRRPEPTAHIGTEKLFQGVCRQFR